MRFFNDIHPIMEHVKCCSMNKQNLQGSSLLFNVLS